MLIQLLGVILTIHLIILIHESGHYLYARKLGFEIISFNIGFGSQVASFTLNHTKFILRLLPLGGYVAIKDLSFNNRHLMKCIKVWLMGSLSNFLVAIAALSILLLNHFYELKPRIQSNEILPVYIQSINAKVVDSWNQAYAKLITHLFWNQKVTVELSNKTERSVSIKDVNFMSTDSILDQLNLKPWQPVDKPVIQSSEIESLKPRDLITEVDYIPVTQWREVIQIIKEHPNQTLDFKVARQHKQIIIPIKIGSTQSIFGSTDGTLPIKHILPKWPKAEIIKSRANIFNSSLLASQRFIDQLNFQVNVLAAILFGYAPISALSGPVGISGMILESLNTNFLVWLYTFAIINISIGIINLLPLPGLDGGQIIIALINRIIGYRITLRWIRLLERIILIFFFILLVKVTLNDIERTLLYHQKQDSIIQ